MKVKSDMLTADKLLQTDRNTIKQMLEILFFDLDYNNQLFHSNHPEVIYIITDFDITPQKKRIIILHSVEVFKEEEVFTLFSAGISIELLALRHTFQLQTFGANWILL